MAASATIEAGSDTSSATTGPWPMGEVLRDIVRGGVAGLIVGVLVGGVGSRVAMRIAALAVPGATGSATENGNRIGDITLGGTFALVFFVGLFATITLATVWVSISPWLPGTGVVKGIVAIPIAVAFGGVALISRTNPDFIILRHDALVVATLLGVVGSTAPAMAIADGWLDRHLPHAVLSDSGLAALYAVLSIIGATFGGILTVQALGFDTGRAFALTILASALLTIAWWRLRVSGRMAPPRAMIVAARAVLIVGTIAGFTVLLPELEGALGLR